jgi:hypothetical protein
MEHKSPIVAVIEIIPKLLWVVVIILVKPSLSSLLDKAGSQIQGGASVDIAGLKITLPKSTLPKPPERARQILPKLDSETIEYILVNVPSDLSRCYEARGVSGDDIEDFRIDAPESRVQALSLIKRTKKGKFRDKDGTNCAAGSEIQFLPVYSLVRSYLIEVLKNIDFNVSG